jgi:hypothetical protein
MDLKHRSRGITGGRDRVPARSMFKANRRRTRWRLDPLRRQPGILEAEISDDVSAPTHERMESAEAALSHRRIRQVRGAGLIGLAGSDRATAKMNWFF